MKGKINISIIGAGNVATHLGIALHKAGYKINEVYSRSIKNATELSDKIDAQSIDNVSKLSKSSDLYVIAINDDGIIPTLKQIEFKDKVFVHTSGSISMNVFEELNFKNYGIFYPLQTFSKDKSINISEVPFCLEANSDPTLQLISNIAGSISNSINYINSEQREVLHLAAVFACNFSNNMYQIAHGITTENNISFDILKPLILETASKITTITPQEAQTGPALRNDQNTLNKHIKKLENKPDLKEIYKLISNHINSTRKTD